MSLLASVSKGVRKRPYLVMVYGQPGVGKSTFAAKADSPLFFDVERRTDHLDIARVQPSKWEAVLDGMRELVKEEQIPFKTLVFDTVDHLELLIYTFLCQRDGVKSIDEVAGGYGKGYTEALNEWRRFMVGLEALRDKGYNVMLLGHGHVKSWKNPTGEDYDRWVVKINQKCGDFLREKVDAVGFAHFDDAAVKKKGETKAKAVGGNKRLLTFEHGPGYESKQGIALPDEVELDFNNIREAL